MRKFVLFVTGNLFLSGVAVAQYYPEGDALGTQWKATNGNLSQFIASGYRLASVILTPASVGSQTVSYYLQYEAQLVRCDEVYSGGNLGLEVQAMQRAQEATKSNQSVAPIPPVRFPSARFVCYSLTAPRADANPK